MNDPEGIGRGATDGLFAAYCLWLLSLPLLPGGTFRALRGRRYVQERFPQILRLGRFAPSLRMTRGGGAVADAANAHRR